MAVSEHFQIEQLDEASRYYLLRTRKEAGKGLPGVFVPRPKPSPGLSFFCGLLVLLVTALLSWNAMAEEPLAVAMLQTAGLLLGGWLIADALREWTAARGSKYAGHFIYADAKTLWECAGSSVTTTNLSDMVEARGVQHTNKQGKFTHLAVTILTPNGTRSFNVHDEALGQELVTFLNSIAWRRSGNATATLGSRRIDEINFQKSSSASSGSVAQYLAERVEMPGGVSTKAFALDDAQAPTPKREGRASIGILNYLLIIGCGVGGVFVFKDLNLEWRDVVVWQRINEEDQKEKRAPFLRAYLADTRNVKHRDDARQMLTGIYDDAAKRVRTGTYQKSNQAGGLKITSLAGASGEKVDAELAEGLAEVLRELAEQPLPLVTVSVKEKGSNKEGVAEREKEMMKKYTFALMESVGPELIAFVEAPPEAAGMIDITYEFDRVGSGNGVSWRCTLTFSFRKSTDGDPLKTVKRSQSSGAAPAVATVGEIADEFGLKTAGSKKIEIKSINNS